MRISRDSPEHNICHNCLKRPAEHYLQLDNPDASVALCHFCFSALKRIIKIWKPTHLRSVEAILPKE